MSNLPAPVLPLKWFFATVDYGRLGVGFGGDFYESADQAVENALDKNGDGYSPFRVFQVDMDPDTNMPERIVDVTEDTMRDWNEMLEKRGQKPLEWEAA